MKKILLSIIICILMLNITVKAESQKEKINIYFFHGNGCPHCEDATKFFDSINEEYGKYYNLVKYEVWHNEENNNLMEKVSRRLKVKESGVPLIIIGKKAYSGYDENVGKSIKEDIVKEYNKKERYDVMTAKEDNTIGIILITSIVVLIAGMFYLRIKNQNTED